MRDAVRPEPEGAGNLAELVERLRLLRSWAGRSYRAVHREVVRARTDRGVAELPAMNTVYRCFQPGRARVDLELVVDVARALTGDDQVAERWRQAGQVISGEATAAGIVDVADDLPAGVPHFVGRARELRVIVGSRAPVVAISGMPGVGKTALAVRAAHRLAAEADLRLAVDLRGHDPDLPPADPAAVLGAFLRRLGLTPDRFAHLDLAARAERYRELTAGRRVLVLLDNAEDARQVAPLLPGSGHTIVTSRRLLTGLDARGVRLGVLPSTDALALLGHAAGQPVVDDPAAAGEIAALAGYLPLALTVVAGRIRAHPTWTLADHVDRLTRHRDLLRVDAGTELAIRLSFDELTEELRRTVELLALHPGEDFDRYAAAALVGATLADATTRLAELTAAHLVEEHRPRRYRLHDLIRTYSRGRAIEDEPATARGAALTRLFDHYARTASLAMDRYAPAEKAHRPPVPAAATPTPAVTRSRDAIAWLDTERHNLLLAAVHAADHGELSHTGHQSATLSRFLCQTGHYREAEILHTVALRSPDPAVRGHALRGLCTVNWRLARFPEAIEFAQRAITLSRDLGDPLGESQALTGLGLVHWQLGDFPRAVEHHRRALDLAVRAGDEVTESAAASNLGLAYWRSGRFPDAVAHYLRALEIAERTGNEIREAQALGNLGVVYWQLGRHGEAVDCEERAYRIAVRTGDRAGQSLALDNLGLMHLHSERYAEAAEHYRRALDIAREIGNRTLEASALGDLAAAHQKLGEHEVALAHYREALAIALDTGNRPGEAEVRTGIGDSLLETERFDDALRQYQLAIAIAREIDDTTALAQACERAGRAHRSRGEPEEARAAWQRALELYVELGLPEADAVRELLAHVHGTRAVTPP